jgi:hypothetical protein
LPVAFNRFHVVMSKASALQMAPALSVRISKPSPRGSVLPSFMGVLRG